MDAVQLFPLWISHFFLCHVLPYAVEHLPGICRGKESEDGGDASVDLPGSLALGLSRHMAFRRSGAVCLWFLQRYDDLHHPGADYNGLV